MLNFCDAITSPVNSSLNFFKLSQFINKSVVVAKDGTGQYSSIETAVAAGHKFISVKEGSYTLQADLTLDGQCLVGASPKTTIINTAYKLIFKSPPSVTTGTVTINTNDLLGTLSDDPLVSYADPWIIVMGQLLKISSIAGTTINLPSIYRGAQITAQTFYLFDAACTGSLFSGFTVNHLPAAPARLFEVSGFNNTVENNVFNFSSLTSQGLYLCPGSLLNSIKHNTFNNGLLQMALLNSQSNLISGNYFSNSSSISLSIATDDATLYSLQTVISHNFFSAFKDTAVSCAYSPLFVSGNRFLNSTGATGIIINDVSNSVFASNDFSNAGLSYCFSGISISSCTFDANILTGETYFDGISFSSFTSNISDSQLSFFLATEVTISSNIITGKLLFEGDNSSVTSNIFKDAPADFAISVKGSEILVVFNVIKDCLANAIDVDSSSSDVTVSGNKIYGCEIGINVQSSRSTITANSIEQYSVTGILVLSGISEITVTSNQLTNSNSASNGIFTSSPANISDNSINTVSGPGIEFDSAETFELCSCSENNISSCTFGVYYNGTSMNHSTFSSNIVSACSDNGISIEGGAYCTVTSNESFNNTGIGLYSGAGTDFFIFLSNICNSNGTNTSLNGTNHITVHNIP